MAKCSGIPCTIEENSASTEWPLTLFASSFPRNCMPRKMRYRVLYFFSAAPLSHPQTHASLDCFLKRMHLGTGQSHLFCSFESLLKTNHYFIDDKFMLSAKMARWMGGVRFYASYNSHS